jgi:hypothetical protein
MYTRARHWSLSWDRCIQSTPSHPISIILHSNVIFHDANFRNISTNCNARYKKSTTSITKYEKPYEPSLWMNTWAVRWKRSRTTSDTRAHVLTNLSEAWWVSSHHLPRCIPDTQHVNQRSPPIWGHHTDIAQGLQYSYQHHHPHTI